MLAYVTFFVIMFICLLALVIYGIYVFIHSKFNTLMALISELITQIQGYKAQADTDTDKISALVLLLKNQDTVSPELQAVVDSLGVSLKAKSDALASVPTA